MYSDGRTSFLSFYASPKPKTAFNNINLNFYSVKFYEGPPPFKESVTPINFSSLVLFFYYF